MGKSKVLLITSWCIAFCAPAAFGSVAPIPNANEFEHAPYAERVCSVCHERDDQANPGAVVGGVNGTCLMCHDEFKGNHVHAAVEDSCTNCHNPHNGVRARFLVEAVPNLCVGCHDNIGKAMAGKSQHGAVDAGKACLNCHNPHATKVEKLLTALPYDLCVNCHNTNNIVDENGKKLTNIKELIESRPYAHGPVAEKDCGSCHTPHGGENFRLLVNPYPAKFYSPYDPKNYELCFTCHDPGIVNVRETKTLTNFRDGSRNMHYLHVNKDTLGRTCRACHEVHAAENPHIVRDSVPYGNSGWQLKINYKKLPDGGSCTKTCHSTKVYRRY